MKKLNYFTKEPNLTVDSMLDLFLNQHIECALFRSTMFYGYLKALFSRHRGIDHTGIVFKVCETLYFSMDLSNEIGSFHLKAHSFFNPDLNKSDFAKP